jgi:serine/threonine protein kinase
MDKADCPQVPDFDLIRPIGAGGFGQVWLAINRTTGQPRAVKIVPRACVGSRDPAGREIASLVRLEANLRCRHPNLLAIHHVGETADHLFYVMDLADDLSGQGGQKPCSTAAPGCDGSPCTAEGGCATFRENYRPATLENRLAAGPLGGAECERYAEELLAALASLHEAGMVHRDVKPANCLYFGGALKLGDFGLLTNDSLGVSRLGTLRYMPPDGCMDARADVYAAGLVIYEMLTGLGAERFPSLGDRAAEVAGDQRLARRLNRLALRACDPDPNRRFRDAREMLAELAAGRQECPPHRERSRLRLRRAGWIALAAVVAAVAALAAYSWMHHAAPVGVNFVTDPYEATIYLDGRLLRAPDGTPYRTPCTIGGLPAGRHHVEFQWDAREGPPDLSAGDDRLDAGVVDFAANRQISVRPRTK